MLTRIHPIAGMIGFVTILVFWISTVLTELFGSVQAISAVKQAIPWGFAGPRASADNHRGVRIPNGWRFAERWKIRRKMHRMPIIAGNGI